MKLSTQTIATLKNFAGINPSIVVHPGNVLKTISEARDVVGIANVEETFPHSFGLYELNEFLRALNLIEDPDVDIAEDHAVIRNHSQSIRYRFASTSILKSVDRDIVVPSCELEITVSDEMLQSIRKGAQILGHSSVAFVGDGSTVTVQVIDPKDPSANAYTISTDISTTERFRFILSIGTLNLLPGDYSVKFSKTGITEWTGSSVKYYIVMSKTSEFN